MEAERPSLWWYPKVLFTFGLVVWAVILPLLGRAPFPVLPGWDGAGRGLAVAGAAIHLWHYAILKRQLGRLSDVPELVTTGGFYPWIRHPMYLGDGIMALGFALWAGDAVSLALLGAAWVVLVPLAREEDRRLADRFPDAHADWAAGTGLLLPGWQRR